MIERKIKGTAFGMILKIPHIKNCEKLLYEGVSATWQGRDDILAIKLRGLKARTNFKYTYQQIKKIGDIDFDIKSKNINDIIAQFV